MTHNRHAAQDFSRPTLRALAANGIRLVGVQLIPDPTNPLPFANPTQGYCLDNNGEHQVRLFYEVIALAQ